MNEQRLNKRENGDGPDSAMLCERKGAVRKPQPGRSAQKGSSRISGAWIFDSVFKRDQRSEQNPGAGPSNDEIGS